MEVLKAYTPRNKIIWNRITIVTQEEAHPV